MVGGRHGEGIGDWKEYVLSGDDLIIGSEDSVSSSSRCEKAKVVIGNISFSQTQFDDFEVLS